ncbi:MAG TPA: glycosyltransferase family A protein, partial [Syntrophales bacterium]
MKVSVVIPVHNGEKYLSQAVESVLDQTHRDLELLVVDDGSTDSSAAIIRRFALKDRRVRVLTQENLGVAAAGNRGLQEAGCEWVARLDADDVFLPGKLERQVGFLRRNPDARI